MAPYLDRRAAQQLKRARTVVRRQLAGVALNGLASDVAVGGSVVAVIVAMILLMEDILYQLIRYCKYPIIHYLQGLIHPRWCRISSINSSGISPSASSHALR